MTADETEAASRAACDRGDYRAAADLVLRNCGPEIFGFLCARVGSEGDAQEAYSDFALDLWRGLERFEWRCTARVWAYTLARNSANRYARERERRHKHGVPVPNVGDRPAKTRTRTPTYMKTPVKTQFRELRGRLTVEEQELLMLRIDKRMPWTDLARITSGGELDAASLQREAARLRKRFQLVKNKLRQMASKEGLLLPER